MWGFKIKKRAGGSTANLHKEEQRNCPEMVGKVGLYFAEFELIGHGKSDKTKKTKAMFLIGNDLVTMAELLGSPEDVTYLEFQTAMLKRDREGRPYGVTRDQALADPTSSRPPPPRNLSYNDPTAQQRVHVGHLQ